MKYDYQAIKWQRSLPSKCIQIVQLKDLGIAVQIDIIIQTILQCHRIERAKVNREDGFKYSQIPSIYKSVVKFA